MECYVCKDTDENVMYVCNKCKELTAHKKCYNGVICIYCFKIASIKKDYIIKKNQKYLHRKRRWNIIVSIMKQWKNNVKTKFIRPIYRRLK